MYFYFYTSDLYFRLAVKMSTNFRELLAYYAWVPTDAVSVFGQYATQCRDTLFA